MNRDFHVNVYDKVNTIKKKKRNDLRLAAR